jgi:hypothetical protein
MSRERTNRQIVRNIKLLAAEIEGQASGFTEEQHAFNLYSDSDELREIEDKLQALAYKIDDETRIEHNADFFSRSA